MGLPTSSSVFPPLRAGAPVRLVAGEPRRLRLHTFDSFGNP